MQSILGNFLFLTKFRPKAPSVVTSSFIGLQFAGCHLLAPLLNGTQHGAALPAIIAVPAAM